MTTAPETRSLAVFISGGGRTLKNIVARIEDGFLPARIALVVASRECAGERWAASQGFATRVMPGIIDRDELGRTLMKHHVEYVALGGYTRLLRVPGGFEHRVVNIHPALLPAFGGEGMYGIRVHEAVINAGCRVSGCTVHFCDQEYDRGPIISQLSCPVLESDTPASLADRVFELEKSAYPIALRHLVTGNLRVEGNRVFTAARSGS
jgi:folate-dependent phosphoribosylglycinamide formyltransferase PurN